MCRTATMMVCSTATNAFIGPRLTIIRRYFADSAVFFYLAADNAAMITSALFVDTH